MIALDLIGIGTGNPRHLTLQAIDAINAADLILIPTKGAEKDDLAGLRRQICADVLTDPATKVVEFALPVRDPAIADYHTRVDAWHDAIAAIWVETIRTHLGDGTRVAFLVWGDPSLYDSTLRIAERVAALLPLKTRVIPGITSIQALTAAHAIPLNEINGPVVVTTGRQIRDNGFPDGADTAVVMLDGELSFRALDPEGLRIWWTGYAGMDNEISLSGAVSEVTDKIVKTRAEARAAHGWIMDIYLLRRSTPA
ncbi:precorrin-6A synthase (deacetylating) [Nioella sediminis]|uniref:precorrin-6A synthase (deacetylating) n=1 Tax=Nioella sediminis TaxID=1912092 RepID=UPI0008FD1126|nr:precorrin-6A synthase (deacetylating) [Nioella sediminis]TBX23528.1 precorrin 6A synthase [Roseovarius sp. JS7-11]